MSVSAYNEGQSDLRNAITNLNQKIKIMTNQDEYDRQEIEKYKTAKNETHSIYKKYETIYTLTGIATIFVVFFTTRVILHE